METNRLLDSYLKTLGLRAFREQYRQVAEDAAQAHLSYDQFLLALAEQEIQRRETNRRSQLIKQAHFPTLKELADFDFTCLEDFPVQRLLSLVETGSYLARAEPILMVGNPGLGKTHLATVLGLAACRMRHKVRFYNAAALVNDLILAQDEHRLQRFITSLAKQRLLILDELGFIPLSPTGAQLLFQLCSALHEHVAVLVTTNLAFADWTQVFGDDRLTGALLDRLTFRAHIFEFRGESFRFRARLNQQMKGGSQTP
jgi:DNA replication protein DnaC